MFVGRVFCDNSSLTARVAHAYFKYGCFCSSHPIATILFSIASLLLLSYPLTTLGWSPSATPFEIVIADNVGAEGLRRSGLRRLDWLVPEGGPPRPPAAYLQQVVVRARVSPWNHSLLTPVDAVKGSLELAFDITDKLNTFRRFDNSSNWKDLNDYCFRVDYLPLSNSIQSSERFPSHGCLLLSPALFWNNNRNKFYDDGFVLDTIYEHECAISDNVCTRHLLFGVTDNHAGVKRQYRTNRQRTIAFAVTIVLYKYDDGFVRDLRDYLESDPSYTVENTTALHGHDKYVLIYYVLRKDLLEHLLLVLSYSLVFAYLYFSVRKIEMVKSKWGLAFSSVFTVAASLAMASGICVNFDLIPRLWKGCIFPYLAIILGLENTLCLTRAVVSTPVTLPVELRISHGLSRDGWLITKTFLIELAVVLLGALTRIPEIQEFCTLAGIGLVVDFYMQLFFYAPCLTFDLLRFNSAEIQRLAVIQQRFNPVDLVSYPPVRCPVKRALRKVFPAWFRVSADGKLTSDVSSVATELNEPVDSGRHPADVALNVDSSLNMAAVLLGRMPMPHRAKLLMAWSRYRYCQTIFTVVAIVWIAWLALVVRQCGLISQLADSLNPTTASPPSTGPSAAELSPTGAAIESSWVHWELAQRTAFRWWPQLFNIYNISLSGQYVVMLPRILLNADVSPDKAKRARSGIEPTDRPRSSRVGFDPNDLGMRISWLEFQMMTVLVMSVIIFITVAAFILYVCFMGGSSSSEKEAEPTPTDGRPGVEKNDRGEQRSVVNAVPLQFAGHRFDVEIVRSAGDLLVSTCLGGGLMIWDGSSGDLLREARPAVRSAPSRTPSNGDLRRRATTACNSSQSQSTVGLLNFDECSNTRSPAVWCMDVQSNLISLGLSNGEMELYDLPTGQLRGEWSGSADDAGATQIRLKGCRAVVARMNGKLDFVELCSSGGGALLAGNIQCHLVKSVRAHQLRVNCLLATGGGVITASDDHTLKLFHAHTFARLFTLFGHNAPVVNAALDEPARMMCSSCVDGLICVWDMVEGHLLSTLSALTYTSAPASLVFTSSFIIAHGHDGSLWLWRKRSCELINSFKPRGDGRSSPADTWREGSSLAVVGDNVAVTAAKNALRFWDLERGESLKVMDLGQSAGEYAARLKNLTSVDGFSLVCSEGNRIYRVELAAVLGG